MKLSLRDALQHIITSGESSPEWESQHLGDVMSTMDNIASVSLSQMTSDRGDLRLAFQTLDDMEPQNEFQAAMAQYARASLQLLESLGGLSGTVYPDTPSTIIPGLGDQSTLTDESKVNLLQSLSEYTDSRVTIATYTSFPSTPFSDPQSLLRSFALSQTPLDSASSGRLSVSRPSMSSRHLGPRISLINSSVLSTPVTYDAESQILHGSNTYYEPLSELSASTLVTVRHLENPANGASCDDGVAPSGDDGGMMEGLMEEVHPSQSHAQNTALCKALALQALTDHTVTPKLVAKNGFPKLRPLGGSSSFRHTKSSAKPSVMRRHSLSGDPLYMTYNVRQPLTSVTSLPRVSPTCPPRVPPMSPPQLPAPHVPRNRVPPRKPARQFSTKSTRRSCTTLDSVKALDPQHSRGPRYSRDMRPSRDLVMDSSARCLVTESPHTSCLDNNDSNPPKHFSFIDKTRSLINRFRFGSRSNRKRESTSYSLQIDPAADKSKTL